MINTLLDKNFENIYSNKIREEMIFRKQLNTFKFTALQEKDKSFKEILLLLIEKGYYQLKIGHNPNETINRIKDILSKKTS